MAPSAAVVPVLPSQYQLVPEDQLNINVQGHTEFPPTVTILPDGTFNFPVAGRVQAAGLTLDELTQLITRRLARVVNQPDITVSVTASHTRKVSVLGAAKTTGTFEYKPGWRVLDALAACGGPAEDALLTSLTLVKDDGKTNVPIDLVKLMSNADPAQNVALAPGDILLFQARDPAVAEVQVLGQVGHPGAYLVPTSGVSIDTLLTDAGGATAGAALTQAQLMHGGKLQIVDLHPTLNSLSASAAGVRLVAGDVLLIPENKRHITVVGEVGRPSLYTLPDGEPMTLLSALTLAGGATGEGDKKRIMIIRKGTDGQETTLTENLDNVAKSGSRVTEIPLQPDDILFVPGRSHSKSFADYLNQLPGLALIANLAKTGL